MATKNTDTTETVKPDNKADETVAGGRYEVNGQLVNANGEPIKD